ncbi:MAG: hypothetical protein N0C80_20085, partial [Candidatus Thiodiazotropha endolucinida]|nr:hypothetical protein [Candidatus Thiodiazotropha taylori]MCW4273205.1 hypothetical protein [Candidatus Thiodiazotropha endolucinida]
GLKEPIGSVLQTASSGSQLKPPALPGDTYYFNDYAWYGWRSAIDHSLQSVDGGAMEGFSRIMR